MFELRHYQRESVDALFEFFRTHPEGHPLIALPPGAGKSLVIAAFIQQALEWYPQTRILNIVHVRELIEQSHRKMVELWPSSPCGVYSAGLKRRDTQMPILFTGIASIAKRIHEFGHRDLAIIDEADMVSHKEETQYRKVLKLLQEINPAIRFVGLTATAWRSGLGSLTDGGVFTDVVMDYCSLERFNRLIDEGFLCPLIPKKTDTELNVDGVHIQNGDFIQSELQAACDKDAVTQAALLEALRCSVGRNHILCFATGIKHANNIRDALLKMGVAAACVHTDLKPGEGDRDTNIHLFKTGQIRVMVGVGVFGVGFDAPMVDAIWMLRPTTSARIHVQFLGRGLRIHPSKTSTLVLDFARNTARLGCINDVMLPRKPGMKGKGMVPFRLCPQCAAYNHVRTPFCCDCGYEFPITFKGTVHASQHELIRRDDTPPKPEKVRPPKPPPPPAEIESYVVNRVEFTKHRSKDETKPPTFKISYICGLRIICEWASFEASGFPKHKANEAWRLMGGGAPPATVDEALARTGELKPPTGIRVLREGKYDRVVGYDFDEKPQPVLVDDLPF